MKRRLIGCQAVLALLVLCAGCVTVGIERSYPEKRYFALEIRGDLQPANPGVEQTLEVSTLRVSPRYSDKNFVYRVTDAGYESDFYNQFLVSPALLITEEVRKGLGNARVFKHVLGRSSAARPGYILEGTVNALYGDFRKTGAPMAVLETEFFLSSTLPEKPGIVMHERYSKAVPLGARSPDALVQGWNEALEAIVASLVADLETAKL
jgi:cholesterol transport system auxiliary component